MSVVLDRHRRRGVAKHRFAGALERVREALKAGPKSVAELAADLDMPDHNVRSALTRLMNLGGVVRGAMPGQQPRYRLYSMPERRDCPPETPENDQAPGADPAPIDNPPVPRERERKASQSGSGVIAGRKTIRGYLW